ncbi:short chain dehydrogenase [Multifurca ochricompacta]|uniref:Short chain dehydrogenase n=1 Tax=Multifurca ochricompacta TaxID=376703 RepID=A0AAD4QK47_9AGAM|nr:short chain dehydrogenase [Multifurca ochricompacta]
MSSATPLVWLIAGTSSGVGRDLTLAALQRGDKVIATARARSIGQLDQLREKGANVLELDVTSPIDKLHEIAKQAVAIHGRVDVLVNNAGYVLVGAIEENTPQETYDQFNTNVFGGLNVARAFLPYMRQRKSGSVVWIGSLGAGPRFFFRSVPDAGLYISTKFALRGLSETLDDEITPLGLRSIIFELGFFHTEFLAASNCSPYISRIEDYKELTAAVEEQFVAYNGKQPGDPKKAAKIIVDLVRGEGVTKGRIVPPVVALGTDTFEGALQASKKTIERLEAWEDVSKSTDF